MCPWYKCPLDVISLNDCQYRSVGFDTSVELNMYMCMYVYIYIYICFSFPTFLVGYRCAPGTSAP